MKPFERIYVVVSSIPKGKVLTYRDVAMRAGVRNPRVVGFALHANKDPKNIPCHRVVRSDGTLANGYAFGGKKAQKEKLEAEGVVFTNDTLLNKFFLNDNFFLR